MSLRRRVYEQLEPKARGAGGLSATNRILVALILVASLAAILETEPLVSTGRELLFRVLELAFAGLFLLEYAARLWTAVENPRFRESAVPRLRYVVTPAALCDLIAIVPALLAFGAGGTILLRFVRVLRILRLAKLGRMSSAWRHVSEAIHSRRYELALTLGIAGVATLAAATALYWAEGDAQPDKFGSIPRCLWWAVVTLTTVGYGDVFPETPAGKVIAGVVAVIGIGVIALPTGIFAAAFSDAIQRQQTRPKQGERAGSE
jgi:voltage-gated potassium channel